jgi:hypothetical protein
MVFAALNVFNPVLTVWNQTFDTAKAHGWHDKQAVLTPGGIVAVRAA